MAPETIYRRMAPDLGMTVRGIRPPVQLLLIGGKFFAAEGREIAQLVAQRVGFCIIACPVRGFNCDRNDGLAVRFSAPPRRFEKRRRYSA